MTKAEELAVAIYVRRFAQAPLMQSSWMQEVVPLIEEALPKLEAAVTQMSRAARSLEKCLEAEKARWNALKAKPLWVSDAEDDPNLAYPLAQIMADMEKEIV